MQWVIFCVQPAYWRAFRKALFPPSVKNIIMQNVTANDSQKTDFTIGSARPNIVRQAPTNFTGAPTPLPPIPGNGNGNGNMNISFQQVTTAQAPARPAAVELTRSEEILALPTFPTSPADLSQALSGLVPVLHHCQFYAADHAAESAGVEDAAASSSSGGCQSDTKGGARLDAMLLASACSRISRGGGWDEDGWQVGSSGRCNGRKWAGASGWLGKGGVGLKGEDRQALFQRQDSTERLASLPRSAVQSAAMCNKSSVAKTCFPDGNLELQAFSEVRTTPVHDGCGAGVATDGGSGRGVGNTKPGRGFERLQTAAAVVIQRVLRGNLACSSSPAPSASGRAKAVTWIASVTSRGRLATNTHSDFRGYVDGTAYKNYRRI